MDIREELLEIWIELTALVWGNRILKELTYHEATILRELRKKKKGYLNATQLSEKSGMKKPQMHRILRTMEEKGLLRREINAKDRRSQDIHLNPMAEEFYERDHCRVLALLSLIVEEAGEDLVNAFIEKSTEMAKVYYNVQEKLKKEIQRENTN